MMTKAPLSVSYCITCKGRKHHLEQTLRANLQAEAGNPNVEFVLLDYDSPDGLGEWVHEHFHDEIEAGRLRYARLENAPHFKMAHAKNMAHRLATGDILVNLDADNSLAPNTSQWLSRQFQKHPHAIATIITRNVNDEVLSLLRDYKKRIMQKFFHKKPNNISGCFSGRIAMRREDFERLRGYDESFSAWGFDDNNMALRARDAGLPKLQWSREQLGQVIEHGNDERVSHLSAQDQEIAEKRLNANRWARRATNLLTVGQRYDPVANQDGEVGCGTVRLNFSDHALELQPLPPVYATKGRHSWVGSEVLANMGAYTAASAKQWTLGMQQSPTTANEGITR